MDRVQRRLLVALVCCLPLVGAGCGASRLILAAEKGETETVRVLLDDGANVDSMHSGRSALFYASMNGHLETVRLLLEHGAKPNRGDMGVTPLHVSAERGHTKIVKHLLASGANPGIRWRQYGALPIHQACFNGWAETALVLLDAGDFLEERNKGGFTPLLLAARRGHDQVVAALLKRGANVEAVTDHHWTALHLSSYHGHEKVVSALLRYGANPDSTQEGMTPLFLAAEKGRMDVLKLLLAAGADLTVAGEKYGNLPVHQACFGGQTEAALALLDAGDFLEARNKAGFTPLLVAARGGYDDLVLTLLERGADTDAANKEGWGALHLACYYGNGKMVPALLAAKADPNARKADGSTPLHVAASKVSTYPERKRLLLAAGADASIPYKDKRTADQLYAANKAYRDRQWRAASYGRGGLGAQMLQDRATMSLLRSNLRSAGF